MKGWVEGFAALRKGLVAPARPGLGNGLFATAVGLQMRVVLEGELQSCIAITSRGGLPRACLHCSVVEVLQIVSYLGPCH